MQQTPNPVQKKGNGKNKIFSLKFDSKGEKKKSG
jgi:hypothetical protein